MDANVGDLVVCVDATSVAGLTEGQVYAVIGFEFSGQMSPQNGRRNNRRERPSYILAEIVSHGCNPGGGTWAGFRATRFRKIDHDKTEACEAEFVTLLKRERVSA